MPATKKPRPRASMTTSHMTMLLVARVSVAVTCHSPHRFSRRAPWQRYRNFIKARRYEQPMDPHPEERSNGPRLEGWRASSFETLASQAPQDEGDRERSAAPAALMK